MKTFKLFITVFLVFWSVNGCQKEEPVSESDNLMIEQETTAEQTMIDVDALVDEVVELKLGSLKSAATEGEYYVTDCPVITLNLTSTPKVMTIDFGTGCTCKDGKVRSGKIIVTATTVEKFTTERVKTFDNFLVDGKKIEGKVTSTVTMNREDHSKVANIEEDVTITFPDNGGKAARKAALTRDYQLNVLGVAKDNVISSWGKVEFTRVSGLKVTKTIDESNPLVYKMECHQIVSGVVTFTTSDNRTWTLDYGNGQCDHKATLTKNGETKEIKLK